MPTRKEILSNRRNGKPASCEPCRRGKIRCDHQQPVCMRCQRRGINSKCWYHPAPLTKAKSTFTEVASGSTNPTTSRTCTTPDWRLVEGIAVSSRQQTIDTGNSEDLITLDHVNQVADVLARLQSANEISNVLQLLTQYYGVSQTTLTPGALLLPGVADLQRLLADVQDTTSQPTSFRALAEKILRNTLNSVDITPSMSLGEFSSQLIKENLRLETVGIICCAAGRSRWYNIDHNGTDREQCVQLLQCSATCLRLVRQLVQQQNDAMVWLAFEQVRLAGCVQGDGDPDVWRQHGALCTDAVFLGVHRESTLASLPFWLAEYRRRTFVVVYQQDKVQATWYDLPPQLCRRFTDCKMPLELTDDELFSSDPDVLELARSKLRPDGWSTNGVYCNATWVRLRLVLSEYREKISEFSFRAMSPRDISEMRDLAVECRDYWDSLPPHVRRTGDWWNGDISPITSIMLAFCHLRYLKTLVSIWRLLEKHDPEAIPSMLRLSTDMINMVLEVGNIRDLPTPLLVDFMSLVLNYGVTSAITLVNALHPQPGADRQVFPPDISRSKTIRNLSVFVAHLENICGVGNVNYALCIQAAKAISRKLDDAIEGPSGSIFQNNSQTPRSRETGNTADAALTPPSQSPRLHDHPVPELNMEMLDSDFLDLDNWLGTVDWTGISSEWTTT